MDLRSRLRPGRIQITTDGLASYLAVIEPLFGADRTDYAQLIKSYESTQEETRYSPAVHTATEVRIVTAIPTPL